MTMTKAQKLEARRLTPFMRSMLRRAAMDGGGVVGGAAMMRVAHILERRGFLTCKAEDADWFRITITDAGQAALQ